MTNAVTSLDNVESWFKNLASPFYTLYRGKTKRIVLRQETPDIPVDEVWESLRDVMKMQSAYGASFTLMVTDRPKGNVPMGEILISLNENQLPGIGGVPMSQNFSPTTPYIGEAGIQKIKEEAKKEWDMLRRIEDLEDELEAKVSPVERYFSSLLENGTLDNLVTMVAAKFIAPSPQAGIQGHPNPTTSSLETSLVRMQSVIPDIDTFMDNFSKWAVENPEQAASFFSPQNPE